MAFSPRFCTPEQSNCQQTIAGEMCGNETKCSGCLKSNVSFYPGFSTRPCLVHSAGSASPVYGFLRSIQVNSCNRLRKNMPVHWSLAKLEQPKRLRDGMMYSKSKHLRFHYHSTVLQSCLASGGLRSGGLNWIFKGTCIAGLLTKRPLAASSK